MELTGYKRDFSPGEGLLPIEIQDLQITANAAELEELAEFLHSCAKKLKKEKVVNESVQLPDSRPDPQTPVWLQVLSENSL